ncbi:MAG: alanine racemase [Treponema sp.]|nr:alanine racemase [Treponema sp.]
MQHNYRLLRQMHGARALAVVKANAYGHGAVQCAQALAPIADGFAVAFVEEALVLREAGIAAPILVLEGAFDGEDWRAAHAHKLWLVVHQESQLRALEEQTFAQPLPVWLKCNTGMNRVGFNADAIARAHQRLKACAQVSDITLMTHLARADEPQESATSEQITLFDHATHALEGARSLANSAGILAHPAARRDWARPGIALYGSNPLPSADVDLRPVMTLESRVFAVRELAAGAPLGYGARFHAPHPMRIGLVAAGYADGYPRSAPDGTLVAVDGRPARLVGRVAMDMLTIDLTDLPEAGIGSRVELWGKQIPVDSIARAVGTISYELLCNAKRAQCIFENGT